MIGRYYNMYFDDCKTLNELKKEYYRLVMLNHPDRGGDTRKMQDINAEYDVMHKRLSAAQNRESEAPGSKVHATTETPEEFREIIYDLLKLEGIEFELCGRWIWINGETKQHKSRLKELGCKWAPKKKMWSWHHAEDSDFRYRGKTDIEEIRYKYGSIGFHGSRACNLATA